MAKQSMDELLKRRMASTKQAVEQVSELAAGNEAYQKIFQEAVPSAPAVIGVLPLDSLDPFFTADIGFKPYSPQKLKAFAEQLQEEGLFVRIIVRQMADGRYEILAGHNRVSAARLAGWTTIPAEIVQADDARATVIAISTNLLQRQDLSIVERGKAYKALLDAKNSQGRRSDLESGTSGENRQKLEGEQSEATSGENRQKYSARALVAEFFGVTEYEIRKAIKIANLVPELADIVESSPRQLNLVCAEIIADYDQPSQAAFVEMAHDYNCQFNKATLQYISKNCAPPTAEKYAIFAAWREARAAAEKKRQTPPKHITFTRKKFEPYLAKFGSDAELEKLFLEFLRERTG
ncbi:MAG: ParB N-terminal domain-containing protein [Oscillospiraceae bacterium]|nr:ParB N-terminal domain-containing protein [Oscillospiraceae bacterium]